MNDDQPIWTCRDPGCPACSLHPRPGESRDAWKARMGALFRAAPIVHVTEAHPRAETRTCDWCGGEFVWSGFGKARRTCSKACQGRAYRARKKVGG